MIERNARARDWWLGQIVITSANNVIHFIEGVTDYPLTIPVGSYWLHKSTHATYVGLFAEVQTQIDASSMSAGSYSITGGTPVLSGEQSGHGLTITADTAFSIDWDQSTVDPRWFGQDLDAGAVAAIVGAGSIYTMKAQKCLLGNWRSTSVDGTGIASLKTMHPWKDSKQSHGRPEDKVVTRWERRRLVRWSYEFIPGAHVVDALAYLSLYATNARLGLGDDHNAFGGVFDPDAPDNQTGLWDSMTDGGIALVIADTDVYDLTLSAGATAHVLNDVDDAAKLTSIATVRRVAGLFYDIRMETAHLGDVTI